MTLEIVLFAAFRVATSLPVLRWPLAGGLLAIGGDLADLLLRDLVDLGGVGDYQLLDKALDQVYLALFLVVALRWEGVERRVAVGLYLYRLAGSILFLVTDERAVLFLFPNVFEPWFIFVAAIHHLPDAAALDAGARRCGARDADRAQARAGVGAPRRPGLRVDDLDPVPRGDLASAHRRVVNGRRVHPRRSLRATLSEWTRSASST